MRPICSTGSVAFFKALRKQARREGGAIGFIEEIDAIAADWTSLAALLADTAVDPQPLERSGEIATVGARPSNSYPSAEHAAAIRPMDAAFTASRKAAWRRSAVKCGKIWRGSSGTRSRARSSSR